MHYFMEKNLYLIYFIYGLSFFISGFIILFQSLKLSKLLTNIKYLGLFFLLHGLADWGPLFYPIQSTLYSIQTMNVFKAAHIVLIIASFYFLALYGVNMLAKNARVYQGMIKQIPNLVIIFLILCSLILLKIGDFTFWHNSIDALSRYFLGLPAAFLTAMALRHERELIKDQYQPRVGKYLKVTYISFLVYAVIAGLIVEKEAFFPANHLNTFNFFKYTGLPIEFFRALTGVVIAYCMVVILDILHATVIKKLEEVEKETIIYAERERISQDIHDGTMQALYGVGLRLQYVDALLKDTDNVVVKEHLQFALQKLNETSKEIRSYITDLRPNYENKELGTIIKHIVQDFKTETNIQVKYDYDQYKSYQIKSEIIRQVSFIIKEALNNIRKHAEATVVKLTLNISDGKVEIVIRDNGKGFECVNGEYIENTRKGIGLKSITRRVNDMKGNLKITSHKGEGTDISIIIPLEVQ